MSATQIILLERVEKLGQMGDIVSVKPGYARNFLLPQKKALRATKDNIAHFEVQRKGLEADNAKRKTEAEKLAKKIEGAKAPIIRQASEAGQLFGSVTSRDMSDQVSATTSETITRDMVELNQNFKLIGLFPVNIVLHPEVRVEVIINIARSDEEAKTQADTGRAAIADDREEKQAPVADAPSDEALAEALDEDALEAEKQKLTDDAEKAEEDAAKSAEKSAEREAKKAAKAAEEAANAPEEEASTEIGNADGAPKAEATEDDE
jgi:large subunit ribosomal protein L9